MEGKCEKDLIPVIFDFKTHATYQCRAKALKLSNNNSPEVVLSFFQVSPPRRRSKNIESIKNPI
jgi:hypothetical protein